MPDANARTPVELPARGAASQRHDLSVLVEDIAATVGLSLPLLAVGMAMMIGDPRYDPLGSRAIGVLLLVVAITVGNEVKALLVGQSADIAMQNAIRCFLADRKNIAEVLHLITLQKGDAAQDQGP